VLPKTETVPLFSIPPPNPSASLLTIVLLVMVKFRRYRFHLRILRLPHANTGGIAHNRLSDVVGNGRIQERDDAGAVIIDAAAEPHYRIAGDRGMSQR